MDDIIPFRNNVTTRTIASRAGHAREAHQLHTRLFSRDCALHGVYLQAARKIEGGYFIPGSEGLRIPAQKEFDEIFSAEVDMLLAA